MHADKPLHKTEIKYVGTIKPMKLEQKFESMQNIAKITAKLQNFVLCQTEMI